MTFERVKRFPIEDSKREANSEDYCNVDPKTTYNFDSVPKDIIPRSSDITTCPAAQDESLDEKPKVDADSTVPGGQGLVCST